MSTAWLLSIPTDQLRPLLDAIKRDHPEWDGSSESLRITFIEGKIDPKAVYSKYYSTKEPWMVVTYGWKSSSLWRLADICEGEDAYGKPLHKGKTVWIDVLITRQFSTEEEALNSQQVVKITAKTYGSAFEHLVVADMAPDGGSILDRAWCQAELATTTSTDGIIITVVGDWGAVKARLDTTGNDFFNRMVASVTDDVALVQEFALDRFGSPEGFNRAVHEGVVGKLEAAHLYNEGCDHYYGHNGKD